MTDDLIARLRSVDVSWSETGEWCAEAADRIEALSAEVERLTLTVRKLQGHQGALEAEVERLREALEPFAFREMEKDDGLADTQYVWETIYSDRVQDWFSYEEIETARAALEGTSDE